MQHATVCGHDYLLVIVHGEKSTEKTDVENSS